jgi:uncharacterized protein
MSVQEQGNALPVSAHERLHFLDIVRGFAVLGIIMVNYFIICGPCKLFR